MPAIPANPETDLGEKGTEELMDVISAYYSLKDALVASDGTKADEAASKLMSSAELFHSGMGEAPKKNEIQQQLREVISKTEAIMATKAEAIEEKRIQFATVSDAMYTVAKLANLRNAGVYQQFCPMAMDDKGAYWLSAKADIENPYYGKKMLTCGEVRDSL
jgi:Cu(I)/Ag(I) efflux system membrane fusion protein